MSADQPKKKLLDIEPISRPAVIFWIAWAAVIFTVGAAAIHFRCGVLSTTLAERDALLAEMTTLEEQAKEADRFEAEVKDFEERKEEILRIRDSQYLWAKKLDQLVDIIPSYVRLESLTVKETSTRREDSEVGPTIEMDCIQGRSTRRNSAGTLSTAPCGTTSSSCRSGPLPWITKIASPSSSIRPCILSAQWANC